MSLVLIIIGITVLISFSVENKPDLKEKMLFMPNRIKHNGEYQRMISSIFIHADLNHLVFNMISLYFLGNLFEQQMIQIYGVQLGSINFLLLYLIGGVAAEIYPFIRHQEDPYYRSLGASGAVSAVIFAAIFWNPTMNLYLFFIPFPIPAYIFGPIYLAFEYFAMKRGTTNIAHDAHIGGALFGIFFVLLLNPNKGLEFFQAIF
ncbi:MAG: rhomboid family intramembrane serine protease [Flavobacteriales bacterium]|nr:rhomboid family intramembrane serine protease [Flavobacteriales bacterium]